jgi:hypothetical protein
MDNVKFDIEEWKFWDETTGQTDTPTLEKLIADMPTAKINQGIAFYQWIIGTVVSRMDLVTLDDYSYVMLRRPSRRFDVFNGYDAKDCIQISHHMISKFKDALRHRKTSAAA